METKWYSDFWNLLTQPFKGGIDQVVQYGTLKKGFLGQRSYGRFLTFY
ncbi:hypothetical protein [Veillonella atypica]|nr:hypothetical protein [Veillonella atypica]VTY42984.1 Uncharacterised protein [Veillonella atypica]